MAIDSKLVRHRSTRNKYKYSEINRGIARRYIYKSYCRDRECNKRRRKKRGKIERGWERKRVAAKARATCRVFRNFYICFGHYTFFVAGVQRRIQIPIAKILLTALDDEARVSRVARHAEDERLGLRRRQVSSHAPSSRFCTSFKKTRRAKYLVRRVRIRARDIKGGREALGALLMSK